jgi:hypothetical protein
VAGSRKNRHRPQEIAERLSRKIHRVSWTRWGPGASGPYFGGDNFVVPPANSSAWGARTFRAMQSFAFQDLRFGYGPVVTINTGVRPGTTTVLTATRAAGGTVCYLLTASVMKSGASLKWSASDNWYEVKMNGAAQDPVPAAVGGRTLGGVSRRVWSGDLPMIGVSQIKRRQGEGGGRLAF